MTIPFLKFFSKNQDVSHTPLPLFFYNTRTKLNDRFIARNGRKVGMYSCGPTVYNYAHIGNLRSYVVSDIVRRALEYNGFAVTEVINITDVGHLSSDADEGEDKMTTALKREDKPLTLEAMKELGDFYTEAFKKDLEFLNIKKPSVVPKASEHIGNQIAYIKTLEEKGYTYKTKDGLYFNTAQFDTYGVLGLPGNDDGGKEDHSRIGKNTEKIQQQDFALWKFNNKLGWESPWGKGFPGWHIECTAMASRYLGKSFDIHTGGIDHIAVHHNNEIAQAEAATGKQFVNIWMHVAFVSIQGKKISKSLKNEILLRNIMDHGISPLAYRYWLLTAHYRSSVNFTWEAVEGAQQALFRLHRHFIENLGTKNGAVVASYQEKFHSYINDDLNTPKAIALVHDLVKDEQISKENMRATLLDFDRVLGLGFRESSLKLLENLSGEKRILVQEIPHDIEILLQERERARIDQNWARADEIRDVLLEKGYTIQDTSSGPRLISRKPS